MRPCAPVQRQHHRAIPHSTRGPSGIRSSFLGQTAVGAFRRHAADERAGRDTDNHARALGGTPLPAAPCNPALPRPRSSSPPINLATSTWATSLRSMSITLVRLAIWAPARQVPTCSPLSPSDRSLTSSAASPSHLSRQRQDLIFIAPGGTAYCRTCHRHGRAKSGRLCGPRRQ